MDFVKQAEELKDVLISWRRDIHQHPELGFKEQRTAGIVARELRDLGLHVREGIAETGVVAVLEGAGPGPTTMVRFDMDALPIEEDTDAPYISTVPGVMHACGHDGHVAIGLGVARLLKANQESVKGRVKFVFQPAEEGLGGAQRMLEEGVMEDPKPDLALGVHLWNDQVMGWIGIVPGLALAAADMLEIKIYGKGGHAAEPHQARDPIVAAAQVINSLQTVVSRSIDPMRAAVVSIGELKAGDTFNVIPNHATMRGTIRTFDPEVRRLIISRVEEVAVATAQAMDCSADVNIEMLTPAVNNDPSLCEWMSSLAEKSFPDIKIDKDERTMGSEDVAYLMQDIPSCYIFIGSSNPDLGLDAPHHNPRFDFDERALVTATAFLSAAVLELLEQS